MNLDDLFQKIKGLRVGVLGDYCLDIYWQADMRLSSLSLETPHHPLPIVQERVSLGAAGNVAACLAALKPQSLLALGLCGNDWRGSLMIESLQKIGADTSRFLQLNDYCTSAYIKPLRRGISDVVYEDPRLDFEHRGPLPHEAEEGLLKALENAGVELDVLLVCDQLTQGCVTQKVRERIAQLGKEGLLIVTDSRGKSWPLQTCYRQAQYAGSTSCDRSKRQQGRRMSTLQPDRTPRLCHHGRRRLLSGGWRRTELGTRQTCAAPTDPVGAGDAFHAALCLALAAGVSPQDAAAFANTAASVTVAKIGMTGTASPDEIRAIF